MWRSIEKMLVIVRSYMSAKAPKFKPGDKLVSANVVNNYHVIEYVINRPVKSYIIKCRFTDCQKYIALSKKKEIQFVDITDNAHLFKTYNKVKEFIQECREKEIPLGTPDIIEVVD